MRWLSLSLLVVLLDQISKHLASSLLELHVAVPLFPGLNMTLVHNTGAAFSILSQAGGWQRWFFVALAALVSLFITAWLLQLPRQQRWLACSLALILGGALGNLVDRVVLGYVVDFIDVYYNGMHWPAFNIADSAISVGAVLLIIDTVWLNKGKSD